MEKPSARYRILQYLPILEEAGFTSRVFPIPGRLWERIRLFRAMRDFDLVFLQKKLLGAVEWTVLRRNSRIIVYDVDDAVMFRDSKSLNPFSRKRQMSFARTARQADCIVAGNEYLRQFAAEENRNVILVPTSLDMSRYVEKPRGSNPGSVTLGWIGSSATLYYLERMRDVWDTIFDRFPHVKLKIVADKFFDCMRMPVIKKQWDYADEIDDLHSFDIGLMPLTDDPWARGKCGFKLLQYMAVGIPAVCSPVGVNKEIVSEGVNGFLAGNTDEWISKLSILVRDYDLRLRLGGSARERVLRNYSVEVNGKKLIRILNSLGPASAAGT